jgi:hypothetical protein
MAPQHIVVDGSNIATEGRSAPSLAQLEEAVAELRREHPGAEITVIVDATFAHRIDPSELDRFERAALAGEYVHPPAGAIGRGDAFLLRVAEKVDATVLSNDSFQEFHGEHPWLFERGRLLGATPVPGIGWIFSPRTPVRGPTSRQAVREAERAKRDVSKAIKVATKEAVAPPVSVGPKPKIGDRGVLRQPAPAHPQAAVPAAVNDPLTFVSFIAQHPLGAEVTGHVDSYTSHGAVVMVGNTQCYVPLANLGHPAPRSAREVLKRGEDATFVVRALDPQRRGVELALPGVGTVSGTPSEEMIEAEVLLARKRQPAKVPASRSSRSSKAAKAAASAPAAAPASSAAQGASPGRGRRTAETAKAPAAAKAARAGATKKAPARAASAKAATPSKAAIGTAPAAAGSKRPRGTKAAASIPVGTTKGAGTPSERSPVPGRAAQPAGSEPAAVQAPAGKRAVAAKAATSATAPSKTNMGEAASRTARRPARKAQPTAARTARDAPSSAAANPPEKAAGPRKSPRATKKTSSRR